MTPDTPYQQGVNYLLNSVIKQSAELSGDTSTYFSVVTKPVAGVSYRATFRNSGEAPYSGKTVTCMLVIPL